MAAPKRTKRPRGRPRALDAKKKANAIKWAKQGNSLNAIAKRLKIGRRTLADEMERDEEFRNDMVAADGEAEMFWVEVLRKCGQGKGSSVQLRTARFALTHKYWRDWTAPKVDPELPAPKDQAPVNVNIQNNVGLRESRQQALEDPEYLEFVRHRLAEGDGNTGRICGDSVERPVADGATPETPGSGPDGPGVGTD